MEKFEIVNSQEELIKSMEADMASAQGPMDSSFNDNQGSNNEFAYQQSDDSGYAGNEFDQQEYQDQGNYDQQFDDGYVDNGSNQYNDSYYEEPVAYNESDVEYAVVNYLSERLGRQFDSIDELVSPQGPQIDERVAAIAQFVQETGRAPEDWFRYQALNPSEMDEMTAIRVQTASEYPNLSYDEINLLLSSKYKLDPEVYSEEEIRLSQLQLKIDSQKARHSIEEIRNRYAAPEFDYEQVEPVFNDDWRREMVNEVGTLDGVEFDLGNGNTFTYGFDDSLRRELVHRNENLPNFFDSYIRRDGSWDHDLFSSHMAVLDNIDHIVSSAYQKGLGDGQRTLVNRAANVSVGSPRQTNNNQSDPIIDQIKSIMGVGNSLTFKI
jgi:hypothetical protein